MKRSASNDLKEHGIHSYPNNSQLKKIRVGRIPAYPSNVSDALESRPIQIQNTKELMVFEPLSPVSFLVSRSEIFEKGHKIFLILFFGTGDDQYIRLIQNSFGCFATKLSILAVSTEISYNDLPVSLINDESGEFVRDLRAVHPLGGGKKPLDAVVILDWKCRKRLFLPLGFASKARRSPCFDDVEQILIESLNYLAWEHEHELSLSSDGLHNT